MPEAPRFHLDENMPLAVAEGLHQRDRECSTTQTEGLMGASDPDQFAFTKRERRILITSDRDFARITAQDTDHPGVILWTGKRHYGKLIKEIDELCFEMADDEFHGRIFYL